MSKVATRIDSGSIDPAVVAATSGTPGYSTRGGAQGGSRVAQGQYVRIPAGSCRREHSFIHFKSLETLKRNWRNPFRHVCMRLRMAWRSQRVTPWLVWAFV